MSFVAPFTRFAKGACRNALRRLGYTIHKLDPPYSEALSLIHHKASASAGDHSSAGEQAEIYRLLRRLDLHRGFAVDIAAADGVGGSCTLGLFRDGKWRGLAVELDAKQFARLAWAYNEFPWVDLAKCKVTPSNIVALLHAHDIPVGFEFLNLDIDSYDLFVIQALLKGGFRPQLISIEINEKIPPPVYFTVLYDEGHVWQEDHFFGCSLAAASEIVKPYGYALASVEYNNAMFVEIDLATAKHIPDQEVGAAYAAGYKDRPNRTELFPWNRDVEEALTLTATEALAFFERFFSRYAGKFELRMAKPSTVRNFVLDVQP